MRGGSSQEVARHLRTLYQFGVVGSFSDEQLLGRFLASRDEEAEEAFAELVHRHGPMVLGVCRRILGDAHDAEDAFQATFLVLARKAASVVRREKVASWLYGVAVRTAREARIRSARRRSREARVRTPINADPPDDGLPAELLGILDEELARLPVRHRGPVVLCELEGLSRAEAARRLGIPEGTLSSRLARARARLRDRLSSRGVALPVAAVSTLLVREARAVAVPRSLLESTVRAAMLVAAGPTVAATLALSAPVASLSEGVIQTMLVAKLKGIALAAGALTAVVSGAVVVAQPGRPGPGSAPVSEPVEVRIGDDGVNGVVQRVPRSPARSEQDDRAAALEKKLDRVLEALERMAVRPPTPELDPFGTPTVLDEAPPPARPAPVPGPPAAQPGQQGGQPGQPGQQGGQPGQPIALPAPPIPAGPPPLADRLRALEGQMDEVQQRLHRLEQQLKSLDARVGGGETRDEILPPPAPGRTS